MLCGLPHLRSFSFQSASALREKQKQAMQGGG
jgi:hypothetical protein